MTKKLTTIHLLALMIAFAGIGISYTHASEVTGTLSSDTTSVAPTGGTSGSLSGNVTGSRSSSSGGGSHSSSGSSGGVSTAPSGEVLGAETSRTVSPAFPNAGFAPEETSTAPWSLIALVTTVVTVFALTFIVIKSKRAT